MFFSKEIGMAVRDEQDRICLTAAALACGFEPVDLGMATHSDVPQARQPPEHPDLASAVRSMRIVVMDQAFLSMSLDDQGPGSPWWQNCPTLILPICDREAGTDQPPNDVLGQPWALHRPLHVETVKDRLFMAVHASRIFAERNGMMFDELHRSRRILDSISSGVAVADATLPDLPLIYVNSAFERMTGYTSGEVCGRNCRFLQGKDSSQSELPKIREALREQRDVRALLKNYRKDGIPFWNELYMSPIFDFDGRLTHFVGFQNDVTAQVEAAHRVQHLATHDCLTGLANRALIMERLKQAMPRARRHGAMVALLFFDLNDFKQVNDSLGHEAGDRLLRVVAERLLAGTRAEETVGRLGGDEFVVVLEDLAEEQRATEIMHRLTSLLGQDYDLGGQRVRPSASVGMSLFPRDGDTAEALLKAADANMYLAKDRYHRPLACDCGCGSPEGDESKLHPAHRSR